MKEMYFRTNAKVERLVGRELITNNTIAIFELVKNSYDAGATLVQIRLNNFLNHDNNPSKIVSTNESYIEIIDNGKGMSQKEIADYWMELGTPNKEDNKEREFRLRKKEIDTVIRRIANGEKGIGRFGVDKIGSYLLMESIDETLSSKTIVHFEWDKFNDTSKLIEDIPCFYEQVPVGVNETSGVKLTIKNLRDKWSWRDVIELKKSLKKFLSPIRIQQDTFKIIFSYPEKRAGKINIKEEEILNDTFDYLKTSIYAKLDLRGNLFYEIIDKDNVVEDKEVKYYDKSPFGAIEVKLYYLDRGDKNNFTKKMGLRTHEYGNIKIFKDHFRVMPYGDPHNDWLEIDNRHAQGVFRTFGTRDLVGYVLLSHDQSRKNYVLKEATDRMGLVEDVPEFKEFKKFIWIIIEMLESYIFNKIQKQTKEATQVLKNESLNIREDTKKLFSDITYIVRDIQIPNEQKENIIKFINSSSNDLIKKIDKVEDASKEVENKIKIYSQITSKEGVLYDTLHAIKNKLAIIDSQLRDFESDLDDLSIDISTEELRIAFDSITKMVERALNKVNSSKLKKEIVFIKDIIDNSVKSYYPRFKNENIEIVNICDIENIKIKCSTETLITNVFENIFDNSVKALSGLNEKIITISSKIRENYVEIYISDNGAGIPENKIPFIFSLWGSNTGGYGIGLATAKDTIEDCNGEISYVDLGEKNRATTFLIKLPIV